MLTRMEISYRSKEPCSIKPEIFSTGGYRIEKDGREVHFDFLDMEGNVEFKDGYLHIDALQKNLDEDLITTMSLEEADLIIRNARKEDFTEIFYECFENEVDEPRIELEVVSITFYDFSTKGDGEPIVVEGESFCNLIE